MGHLKNHGGEKLTHFTMSKSEAPTMEYRKAIGQVFAVSAKKLSAAVVKNIKRRVYDCLNVMNELGLISKDPGSRRISCHGLNQTLEKRKLDLQNRLKKKQSVLRKYEEEVKGLQNLSERNQRNYHDVGHLPEARLMLPFTLLEISGRADAVDWKLTDNKETLQIQSNRFTSPHQDTMTHEVRFNEGLHI
ncbi:hypothetical protein R1sor_024746 [Riccia sorocarpa]|uniref:E2F/DP family winged-helix DNA-binding domain-containing protein n=1 Tax=Riccia sorocarpa TaxID=122646 RepID=A0ABD3GUK7_9MARC